MEKSKFKGGVLLIGSLLWQSFRDAQGDEVRNSWRNRRLDHENKLTVRLPVRYGRFSGNEKKQNQTYTMVFDPRLEKNEMGSAWFVPFKLRELSFSEFFSEAREFSSAEGKGEEIVKGIQNGIEAWCIVAILLNPRVSHEKREYILNRWKGEISRTNDPKGILPANIESFEEYCLSEEGELLISWPPEIDGFDFVLATSTKPKPRDKGVEITVDEIGSYVVNRDYFFSNILHGITTHQDEDVILSLLNRGGLNRAILKEVTSYVLEALEYYRKVKELYESVSNDEAIECAANGVVPMRTKNCNRKTSDFAPHQYRVGRKNCQIGASKLLAGTFNQKMKAAHTFEELIDVTTQVARETRGLGDLWSYDTAQRFGFNIGVYPLNVYLQRGAKFGAFELAECGFISRSDLKVQRCISNEFFSDVFPGFPSYLIENLLCVGKNRGWFRKEFKSI